jgi:DNA-binding CsgD family transcriptional regulator
MLFGREKELIEIDRFIDDTRQGFGATLVIRGETGSGKTSLLEYAAQRAVGFTTMRSVGVRSERELAFAGLHLLVRPFVAHMERLPVAQAGAMYGALGLHGISVGERFLVGLGLLTMLSDMADKGPVLCLIDDAHWMDQASVDALLFAAHRLEATESIAVIFATADEPGVLSGHRFPELVPRRLDRSAAAKLLTVRTGYLEPHLRDQILAQTQGNPLALVEFSDVLGPEQRCARRSSELLFKRRLFPASDRVLEMFRDRIHALSDSARTLLALAAADESGDLRVVLDASERLGCSVTDLEQLELDRLVHFHGERLIFRHPLLRNAAYASVGLPTRLAVHRALADVLDRHTHADQRVRHLAAGTTRPDEDVAAELVQNAERVRARGGCAQVAAVYEDAARLSPDAGRGALRLVRAAQAALDAGRTSWAVDLTDRCALLAPPPNVRAEGAVVQALVALEQGSLATAHDLLVDAATETAPHDARSAALLLLRAMAVAWTLGAESLITNTEARASDLALRSAADTAVLTQCLAQLSEMFTGRPRSSEGVPPARRLVALAHSDPAQFDLWQRAHIAGLSFQIGDLQSSRDIASALHKDCRNQGAMGVLPQALVRLARAQLFLGMHRDALTSATEGLRVARDTNQEQHVPPLQACLAYLAALEGDEERCGRLVHLIQTGGHEPAAAWGSAALGMLDLGQGRCEAALQRFEELASKPGWRSLCVFSHFNHVEAATRARRPERIQEHIAFVETWADHSQQAWAQAVVHRHRALLAPAEKAEELFTEALRMHADDSGPAFERARTQLMYGEWLRRTRRRADAHRQLRAAGAAFRRLGAASWLERTSCELRASGARGTPLEPMHDPLAVLTPQEAQIARLTASGLTNRDIAGRLYLSPRTIGYHLYKIYPKLGVSSRTELARLLHAAA